MVRAKIRDKTVKIIKEKIAGDKEKMEQLVVEATLQNVNLLDWLKYSPLSYDIKFGYVYPTNREQMIVAISMGKDQGVLAIYTQTMNDYRLVEALTEFAPIIGLEVIKTTAFPTDLLVVEEYCDELTGAFYQAKTKSIFIFRKGSMEKVWHRNTYLKELYPDGDILKGDRTQWLMKVENVKINISPHGKIVVVGSKTYWKSTILGEINGEYERTGIKEIRENYDLN